MRLGEIHEWLYHKIVLLEKTEEAMMEWANSLGLPANTWMEAIIDQYGKPTEAKPLKKIIDRSNIHGWLQDRVKSTEFRQAALITKIVQENPEFLDSLSEIFKKQAEIAAHDYKGPLPKSPEEIYIVLNDYILEGMPTDRVNEVLSGNENVIIWRTTTCLHKPYWDEVSGDIKYLYALREAWIKAFIETLTPEFTYVKRPNGDHKIVRK